MKSAHTWSLRFNLDSFNHLCARLRTDEDRLLAFQGLSLGVNGGECQEDDARAFRMGWELGNAMHEESIEFRRQQAERGRASAEKRKEATGSAQPKGPPTTVRTVVGNENPEDSNQSRTDLEPVSNDGSNHGSNGGSVSVRTERQPNLKPQTTDTPLTPQGDEERDLEMGDTEKRVASAWDSIAVPAGFAPAGPWSKRRRRALRSLIEEMGEPADKFVRLWARAVQVLSKDAWSREQRVNIDGLLVPDLFRRRLDAWQPPVKESRTPPPKPPVIPPEVTRANHKALIEGLRQGGHHAE